MNKVLFGDCRTTLRDLKAQGVRVQCCVTSPPYYRLRDYGHPKQIGLEKTPAEYVAALVEVFDGARELLADDGVLWLNLGDSYAGTGKSGGGAQGARWDECGMDAIGPRGGKWAPPPAGFKPKDLMGIPWRVAFALQEAGWYLRQDIIWHKPNPMPESVTDRCTKAHEYLFLLTKSERYYWDAEAMQEDASEKTHPRRSKAALSADGVGHRAGPPGNPPPKTVASNGAGAGFRVKNNASFDASLSVMPNRRNRRSVWTVPTKPYSGAHFAVFPPELIEPCILASSRPGDLVLDPFMGSGTTAQVAQALGRAWIGCELNPQYRPLQNARTAQGALAL